MKTLAILALLTASVWGQQQEMVSIPKDKLTEQQKAELNMQHASSWVGMGREIGEAVNSSMQAITTQSNNFSQTPVGKLTVFIVIWKVIGDQAIHVLGGVVEVVLFVPLWVWSYRRMCMTRRVKTGKDTWQVVEYQHNSYDFTPRIAHGLAVAVAVVVILMTVFSY
jgi:hypothetical protein